MDWKGLKVCEPHLNRSSTIRHFESSDVVDMGTKKGFFHFYTGGDANMQVSSLVLSVHSWGERE